MLQRAAACSDSPTSTGQQSHSAEGAEPPVPVLYVILWMGLAPHPTLSAVCISASSAVHSISGMPAATQSAIISACDTATGVSLLRQAFSTAWGVDPKPRAATRIEARQDARSILYAFVWLFAESSL